MKAGRLIRYGRGVYAPANVEISGQLDWELACLHVSHGVLCLITALVFHEIGTQCPHEVWIAIGNKAWAPRGKWPPIRCARFSEASLKFGVKTVGSGHTQLRVYTAAKTVADCFKFRNKIGIDVAVEALREGWRERKFTMDELDEAARVCRVSRVMRPYLEMLL